MDERPVQDGSMSMQHEYRQKRVAPMFLVLLRLLLAFASGWLFTFFATKNTWSNNEGELLLFVLPLILGVLAAWTVDSRSKHLVILSLATGWLVILGAYVYWSPGIAAEDAREIADCAHRYCHVAGIGMAILNIALIYSVVLVTTGVLVTSLIIRLQQRHKQKKEAAARYARPK